MERVPLRGAGTEPLDSSIKPERPRNQKVNSIALCPRCSSRAIDSEIDAARALANSSL